MSKYAQLITSFEREGNFPLEANYIFPTEEALKQFFSEGVPAATLHKGLLKIVEKDTDGNQALYWVIANSDNSLEFTKLISGSDTTEIKTKIQDTIAKLEQEIADRKAADTKIWGTDTPDTLDVNYNSISNLITQLKTTQKNLAELEGKTLTNTDSLKNQIKTIAGTTDDDVITFIKSLPYGTVKTISAELDRIINNTGSTTNVIDTLYKLVEFTKGYTTSDTLQALLDKLWNKIEGDTLPSEQFRTLRGIEDWLIKYKTENAAKQAQLLEEINNAEEGVGLSVDGTFSADASTNYLKDATSVMNALRILDTKLHDFISQNTLEVQQSDPIIKLKLTQGKNSQIIDAIMNLSSEAGNSLERKNDGLYINPDLEYDKGTLTFKINGKILRQYSIGANSIVQDASYDKDNEQLKFIFKLDSGDTQTVLIPVGALIREWEPVNSATSPIELTRTQSTPGTDALSADVRLSTKANNILVKDGNTLYVKGTTDNLYHAGKLLETYLNDLSADLQAKYKELSGANSDLATDITNLQKELDALTATESTDKSELQKAITKNASDITVLTTKVTQEIQDRKDADTVLNTSISNEQKRAEVAEGKNTDAINSETERAKAAEEANAKLIQTQGEKLDAEIQRSTQKDTDLEAEITANTKLLTTLTGNVSNAEKAISAEQARALSVEQSLQSAIDSEKNRAKAAEEANAKLIQSLDGKLSAEVTRSTEKDAELAQQIQNVVHPEYTITKQTTPNEGCIATFILTKNDTPVGSAIDIPLINLDVTYEKGLMTFKVDGKTIKQFNIGVSDVVKSAVYNPDAKQLEFVFNLENGGTQSKNISLSGLVGTLDSEINVVKTDLATETSERKSKDSALESKIDTEITRAKEKDEALDKSITDEIARAKTAEEANAKLIQTQGEKLDTEIQRASQKDTDLEVLITANTKQLAIAVADISAAQKAISTEESRAINAENALEYKISGETDRAKLAEETNAKTLQTLATKVDAEITRATGKDTELEQKIQNVVHPEYSISKQTTPNDGCIATFILTKNGAAVGSAIDIPLISLDVTYDKGLMSFVVDGKTVKQFNIGVSDVVKSAIYNPDAKVLEFVFNLENGGTQSKNISLAGIVDTLQAAIDSVSKDLVTETSDRKSKDSVLESKIDAEVTRATEKDNALDKSITDEIARAKEAEAKLERQTTADYTLTESQSTDPQYKSVYNLTKNGTATGVTIKVPKAMTIKTEDKSLVFTPNTDNPSEVSAKVNVKVGGGINLDDNGLSVDNSALTKYTGSNAVSVQDADGTNTKKIVLVLDQDSEDYLSITGNGLKLAGIAALAEKLDELDWAEPDA